MIEDSDEDSPDSSEKNLQLMISTFQSFENCNLKLFLDEFVDIMIPSENSPTSIRKKIIINWKKVKMIMFRKDPSHIPSKLIIKRLVYHLRSIMT